VDFTQVLNEELESIGERRRRIRELAPQPPEVATATRRQGVAGSFTDRPEEIEL
jgi:hypothetical protein